MKKHAQSLIDIMFPQLQNMHKNSVDAKAARKLFAIWKDEKNALTQRQYRRPSTMSLEDIKDLEKHNLVKAIGDKIEITKKGADVIKVMILGNDISAFEPKIELDYNSALANTRTPVKSAKKIAQKNSDNWWNRF